MNTKSPLPLTLKEKEVLEFIESFVTKKGIAPSYQEIRKAFGFASFNSVQRYLKQLQAKNYLYLPGDNQKRAIQVLQSSKSYANLLRITSASNHPQTKPNQRKEASPTEGVSPPQVESLSLPLLGRVAAGVPIEAFLNEESVDVPASLIRYPSKTFGLVVQGQSMIEDGIHDGDLIFVQKQTYAQNGDTVVATMENQATVKRFYLHNEKDIHNYPQDDSQSRSGPLVELRPANSQMKSLWVEPDRISIQGIVVALLRRF